MKMDTLAALRLADLTDRQLNFEIDLIKTIISVFPLLEPPQIIVNLRDLRPLFLPQVSPNDIFSQLHIAFLRFMGIGFIKKYNPIDFYSKDIIKFEVKEKELRVYLKELQIEIDRRGLTKPITPILKVNLDKCEFTYQVPDKKPKTYLFKPLSNEHKILTFFSENPKKAIPISELIDLLNAMRAHANADPKRRVHDVIKSIRGKLGTKVILRVHGGFLLNGSVLKE